MSKSRKSYIAILGRSIWALLNTYYAAVRNKAYYPDSIYVFTEEPFKEDIHKVEEGLRIISMEFGFAPTIQHDTVKKANFFEAGCKISSLVRTLKESGSEVAVDITSGRKAMVAGTLISLAPILVDHVYYLVISSLEDASKPYTMIPLQNQTLKDFVVDSKD